jgi:hypothetical protein
VSDTTRIGASSGARDPRIDKVATYALQTFMAVALSIGGWYAKGTGEKVDALASQLADLRTQQAVQAALVADAVNVRRDLSALQIQVAELRTLVATGRPPPLGFQRALGQHALPVLIVLGAVEEHGVLGWRWEPAIVGDPLPLIAARVGVVRLRFDAVDLPPFDLRQRLEQRAVVLVTQRALKHARGGERVLADEAHEGANVGVTHLPLLFLRFALCSMSHRMAPERFLASGGATLPSAMSASSSSSCRGAARHTRF